MSTSRYLIYNLIATITSLLIGTLIFYWADETRYIKFQLIASIVFSLISMFIFTSLQLSHHNKDMKAIGISMIQTLVKLVISLALLIPFYTMYCPVDTFYLLNFIITYIIFMILDIYVLSK